MKSLEEIRTYGRCVTSLYICFVDGSDGHIALLKENDFAVRAYALFTLCCIILSSNYHILCLFMEIGNILAEYEY